MASLPGVYLSNDSWYGTTSSNNLTWGSWCDQWVGQPMNSATAYRMEQSWYSWHQQNITCGTSVATSNIWISWNANGSARINLPYTGNAYAPPETEAEQQARLERQREIDRQYNEQLAERRKKEAEAKRRQLEIEARARELLLEFLDEEQKKTYLEKEHFFMEVIDGQTGEKKRYRIDKGFAGNVRLVDETGKIMKRYCIHPSERVPDEDCMLAQKLLLETDEARFLRVANAS